MKDRKLKHLYLFEEFKETPQYRAARMLQAMLAKMAGWFKTGAFSKQNAKCTYLERGDTDTGLQNTLSARFHDKKNYFTLTVTAMTADMVGGTPEKVHVKLKRYDADKASLLNTKEDDIAPDAFEEDYLLKLVADASAPRDLDDETAKKEETQEAPAQGAAGGDEEAPAQDAQPSEEELSQDL